MSSRVSLRFAPGLLLSVFVSLAGACASGPTVETEVYERPDGVLVVETTQLRATVVAVDAKTREVTLRRDGTTRVVTAGDAVANFDQIRVGDELNVLLVDELAVNLIPGGTPPSAEEATEVALAPLGGKPGVVVADTVVITGTVVAIDGHEHTLALEFLDGTTREIKVGKHRDLSQVGLGDSVRIALTEAIAIEVQTPER